MAVPGWGLNCCLLSLGDTPIYLGLTLKLNTNFPLL